MAEQSNPAADKSRGTTAPAKGFDWKKYDKEHPDGGGVKVKVAGVDPAKTAQNYLRQSDLAARMTRFQPTKAQYDEIAKKLGGKITVIGDEIQIDTGGSVEKAGQVLAEIDRMFRANVRESDEEEGAKMDVTERDDPFTPQ